MGPDRWWLLCTPLWSAPCSSPSLGDKGLGLWNREAGETCPGHSCTFPFSVNSVQIKRNSLRNLTVELSHYLTKTVNFVPT